MRAGRRLATAAALVFAAGCRNPFAPSSDIELSELRSNQGTVEIQIGQADVDALARGDSTPLMTNLAARATFVVRNLVGVTLTSINIVYLDLAGNPVVPQYGEGGKSFAIRYYLQPPRATWQAYGGNEVGLATSFDLMVVDRNVFEYIRTAALPRSAVARVTFRGEDENGYNVKLAGDVTIKYAAL